MKRHVTIATLFACAALTASSLWAAAPFGQIQGLQNGYTGGTGSIPLVGWALDDDGIARVTSRSTATSSVRRSTAPGAPA